MLGWFEFCCVHRVFINRRHQAISVVFNKLMCVLCGWVVCRLELCRDFLDGLVFRLRNLEVDVDDEEQLHRDEDDEHVRTDVELKNGSSARVQGIPSWRGSLKLFLDWATHHLSRPCMLCTIWIVEILQSKTQISAQKSPFSAKKLISGNSSPKFLKNSRSRQIQKSYRDKKNGLKNPGLVTLTQSKNTVPVYDPRHDGMTLHILPW